MSDDRKLAMFIDFENIVRGVKEAQYKQFEIKLVLERLVEKGKIMVKRAYADWNRFAYSAITASMALMACWISAISRIRSRVSA